MIIQFEKIFEKQFKKFPQKIQGKFHTRLEMFSSNTKHPLLKNHKLHGVWVSHRSINITGDIRAIYKEESERIVIFVAMGTHGELYKS